MTTLREAATHALEALEGGADSWQLVGPAIDALKEALAEDAMQKFTDVSQEIEAALAEPVQEPVAGRAFFERILAAMEGVIDVADRKTDEFDALRSCVIDLTLMLHTAPPQRPAEPVQEPVAYSEGRTLHWHKGKGVNDAQLYLAPPQRKPLTEEEIAALTKSYPASSMWRLIVSTARAIERAHGII